MDVYNAHRLVQFNLEGEFLGFIKNKKCQLKHLRIAVESSELKIKLSKECRAGFKQVLVSGDRLQVLVRRKQKRLTDEPKLVAHQIIKFNGNSIEFVHPVCGTIADTLANSATIIPSNPTLSPRPKFKLLVCQKSGCVKRGGKTRCQEVEAALCDRGLEKYVTIERTGCQKCCDSAPNMLIMPGKIRCSKMRPKEIADLIAKHLNGHLS